ncbi:IclR family transcriptional regulator C-terminal domain-containing protein [Tersicoccus sp. Bi-70]|uniref:IclR family transcriptional regulator domain-containing protein n=1 Tax=Tersicoccus sp. Bi-70 TaxID=1897634 RepID=UPI0009771D7D|nr:IclR family transcriptional regulator C-terminal domain-containing protein [Tersicoccus sp. Bi-70]OMH34935.1 IclR family transcriptional regulator [Tersicoccus sp. Bi-70]
MTTTEREAGTAANAPGDQFVQSLARGLEVIRAFDAQHPELSLSDVARRTGLTRATARRFLLTLVELGYVRTDGRLFRLTPQVLRLGYAYLSSMGLTDIAQPHLEALSAELGESTSASVLDGADIVYVARVATRRLMMVGISVGTRFPAYATSMGRVLLAAQTPADLEEILRERPPSALTARTLTDPAALRQEIDRVREAGWAVVDQELEAGLRSVAAPVHGANGEVVAAINVSMSALHSPEAAAGSPLIAGLLATAAAISADLRTAGAGAATAR